MPGPNSADPPTMSITHPVLLLNIPTLYPHVENAGELYDATRGVWRLSVRRNDVQYAFAVFERFVKEVYRVERWQPVLEAQFETDIHQRTQPSVLQLNDRWVFTGHVAEERVRSLYIDRNVANYFLRGSQNPVRYGPITYMEPR